MQENPTEFVKLRNRELHYHKALLLRMERENRRRRLIFISLAMPLFSLMAALFAILLQGKELIEKRGLQRDISTIIINGGDLSAVKRSLQSYPTAKPWAVFFPGKSELYSRDIPLSSVLSDIRIDAFRSGNTEILSTLEPLIHENEKTNPFDKLQPGQKDYFENIIAKIDDEYPKVSNDLNRLAEELYRQNILVDEYLGDSEKSFWISIVALLLSLAMGGYQIFSARPEAMKKLFLSTLESAGPVAPQNKEN